MQEDRTHIREALALLRTPRKRTPHSWTRGAYVRETKGGTTHCIIGSLEETWITSGDLHRCEPGLTRDRGAVEEVINEVFPVKYGWQAIADFNDRIGRKFPEIELVMEKAAAMREEQGAHSAP